MDLRLLWSVFVLSQLLPFSAQEDSSRSFDNCPENFQCGNRSLIFPFANLSHYNCGLCVVDCSNESFPRVALKYPAEKWFQAKSIENSIMTRIDRHLQFGLANQTCWAFYWDILLPNSPSISFTILNNITLFTCRGNSRTNQKLDDFFHEFGYGYYGGCKNFTLYYKYPNSTSLTTPPLESLDSSCSIHYLPKSKTFAAQDNKSHVPEVFRLLGAEFDLQWNVSEDCYDCHHTGAVCPTEGSTEPHCGIHEREHSLGIGKKKLGVILGSAIAGVACIFWALVTLLIWCHKKGINDFPYIFSRRFSKLNLEDGNAYFGLSVFSYSELEKATKNFDSSKELGDGGFGTVYHGKLRDGREVAVKRLYEHNFKRMEQFMNEIEILTRLRHQNLVTLYGCTSRRSRELLLVYEYISNGTVADHLHGETAKRKFLTWEHRMNIAIETAEALAYLHASDIIHRDVKTNNLLLDHNFCVKVADFGLSRLFPSDVTHISTAPQGTAGYVDPEYHQCYRLTDKSDVYSFGVALIELISSLPAVDMSRHRHDINLANLAINRIQKSAFDELIDPALGYKSDAEVMRMTTSIAELAFQCLQGAKEMRPTMVEVLETLKEIQNFKEISVENRNDESEKFNETESMPRVTCSPESEDRVLLKNVKFPSSPTSVTNVWVSISTSASTSS